MFRHGSANHTIRSERFASNARKPCDLQGFQRYRYGDSNPGFRRERAAS